MYCWSELRGHARNTLLLAGINFWGEQPTIIYDRGNRIHLPRVNEESAFIIWFLVWLNRTFNFSYSYQLIIFWYISNSLYENWSNSRMECWINRGWISIYNKYRTVIYIYIVHMQKLPIYSVPSIVFFWSTLCNVLRF